jgi:gliding motility-associated protein GldM
MLALNMSKEVLTAFGLMNEKFETVNKFSEDYNKSLFSSLESKASDNAAQFGVPFQKAKQVQQISKTLYKYLGTLKEEVGKEFEKTKEGKLPYEAMDKGGYIDEHWFKGDGYSAKGQEIVDKIEKYKKELIAVFGNDVKYQIIVNKIKGKFDLGNVKDKEGVSKKYLAYHFEGFPAIASIAKLTSMQNDVEATEQDIYNALIGNTTAQAASMKNYKAIVIMDKSAFFQGETVSGRVVLGRYDESTVPTAFSVNGGSAKMENGQAIFKLGAGGVGEHDIKGKFTFMEDGKQIPIDFTDKYVVVPQPKSANISADKMNVVYRGLPNPMTISFAGISDDKVKASAPGLTSSGGPGKYNLNPGSGTDVTVSVTATLPDGKPVSDKKVFRIKNIPAPAGAIGKQVGVIKGAKSRLEASEITAELQDFLYDLNFQVTQFTMKVQGQPAVVVNGNKINAQCKAALNRVTRGDQVTISNIKSKIIGATANIVIKDAAPVFYEIQ